jgi:hypothetical protein
MFNNFYLILLLSLTFAFCVFQSYTNGHDTTLLAQGQVMQQQEPTTQQQQSSSLQPPPEVSITSPTNGQNVSTGELTISGTSSDTPDSQCLVYVDWNDRKPFQRAVAAGPGGNEDYSKWNFTYTDTYHTITNGTNDLTSKVSCIANPANLTKWSSINVTGVDGLSTPAEGQMSSVTQVQNSSSNGTNSTMASSIVVNSDGITSSLNLESSGAGGCGGVGGDGGDGGDGKNGQDGADGEDGANCRDGADGADGGDAGAPTTADEDDEEEDEEEEDDCNIGDAGFPFCDGRFP